MDDDTVVLLAGTGQEAGYVDEGDERDIESVAETDETGTLAAGVAVEHTCHGLGLVGDDTDAHATHVGEADHQVGGELLVNLEEAAVVDDGVDNLLDVVCLVGVLGDKVVKVILKTVDGVLGRNEGGLLEIITGDETYEVTDELDGALLCLSDKVGNAALGGVNHGAAKFVDGDILASDGLDHLRAGKEHVAVLLRHENKVGQSGAVDRAAGAGAENGADLRNNTRGKDIALENLGISGQGIAAFLDTGSARVVKTDDGGTDLHGLIHYLANLQGHGLAQRTAEDGEILCEHIDDAASNGTVACDYTVAKERLLLHVEVGAAVGDEHVELFERAFVKEEGDTLAGGQFALLVLLVDAFLPAADFGLASLVEKFLYFFFKSHSVLFFKGYWLLVIGY